MFEVVVMQRVDDAMRKHVIATASSVGIAIQVAKEIWAEAYDDVGTVYVIEPQLGWVAWTSVYCKSST